MCLIRYLNLQAYRSDHLKIKHLLVNSLHPYQSHQKPVQNTGFHPNKLILRYPKQVFRSTNVNRGCSWW